MNPILRWTGGKRGLKKEILKRIPPHDTYIEPFVGGGSVFFAKPRAKKEIINDKDKDLIDFYKACRRPDVSFKKANLRASRERYEKYKKSKPKTPQSKVNRFLYLNKRSFGGVMNNGYYAPSTAKTKGRGGGQEGIKKIGREQQDRLRGVKIENRDFEKVIKDYDNKNAFIYMDPPYYGESHRMYKHDDRSATPERVLQAAARAKGKCLVSYNDCPEVRKIARKLGLYIYQVRTKYSLNSASNNKDKTELLISNYPMRNGKPVKTKTGRGQTIKRDINGH